MNCFRTTLMTLALGFAAVYMWNGMSIAMNTVPVKLPTASDDVLFIFPSSYRDASRYYIPEEGEIVNGRDLTLYNVHGYVDSCMGADEYEWRDCLKKRDAARRFVFDHWKEKQRGYIQIGLPCIDCGPVLHIFIEPDTSGEWQIVTTLATNGPLSTTKAFSLKFRRADEDEDRRTESKTVLSFLDRNGNEADYF